VDEVGQEEVGPLAPDDPRRRVEVVVVQHHDRLLLTLDLLEDGARQVVVDHPVAVLIRRHLVRADVLRVREVPEVVLDEPQHRVREDVVEAVVGLVVADDEADVVLAALRRVDDERLAAGLARAALVAVGERRRDPDGVAVRRQAGEGRDETTRAALDRAVVLVGDGSAVGDEDERGAFGHESSSI
jgi:hypothetical protein